MHKSRVKNHTVSAVFVPPGASHIRIVKSVTKQKYARRETKDFACIVCGEWFPATRNDARFCTPKCRKQYSRNRGFFVCRGPAKAKPRPRKV